MGTCFPRQHAIHGQTAKRMGKHARLVEVVLEWLDELALKENRGQLARQQHVVKLNLGTITERADHPGRKSAAVAARCASP